MSGAAAYLRALSVDEARAALLSCCGSTRWVEEMLAARPYAGDDGLFEAAEAAWGGLDEADWREAFASHPRIGDRGQGSACSPASTRSAAWSRQEQTGASDAAEETLRSLDQGNQEYQGRFGHVFLICATGRSALEMLEALRRRLTNDPETELQVAAGEQAKITRLRLEKLTKP